MVCTECEEWPKEKRSEIMFSFFVSDKHNRKLQHRLNEKLWLVENYLRTHASWRSNGPFHISQCSQNPSKSIDIYLNLTISTYPTSPSSSSHYHRVMPTPTTRDHLRQKCACGSTCSKVKVALMCFVLGQLLYLNNIFFKHQNLVVKKFWKWMTAWFNEAAYVLQIFDWLTSSLT